MAPELTRDEDSQPEVKSDNISPLYTASNFVLRSFHLFHLRSNLRIYLTMAKEVVDILMRSVFYINCRYF